MQWIPKDAIGSLVIGKTIFNTSAITDSIANAKILSTFFPDAQRCSPRNAYAEYEQEMCIEARALLLIGYEYKGMRITSTENNTIVDGWRDTGSAGRVC